MPDVLDRLGEQLEEIQLPDAGLRREAALWAAQREAATRRRRRSSRSSKGLRLALAAGLLGIVVVAALTPPGRAAAEWIAERVGIGEPGGEPSLREFREFTTQGSSAEGQRATVVARGPAPYGGHYEVLTYEENRYGSRCYELNLVNARGGPGGSYGAACERAGAPSEGAGAAGQPLPESGGLRVDTTGGNSDPDQELLAVVGRVSADVADVEVTFNGRELETEVIAVSEELTEEVGIEHPFKVFAAFSRELGDGGMIEVVALDEAGEGVARFSRHFPVLRFGPDPGGTSPFGKPRREGSPQRGGPRPHMRRRTQAMTLIASSIGHQPESGAQIERNPR